MAGAKPMPREIAGDFQGKPHNRLWIKLDIYPTDAGIRIQEDPIAIDGQP
jgi:hypothetical protein